MSYHHKTIAVYIIKIRTYLITKKGIYLPCYVSDVVYIIKKEGKEKETERREGKILKGEKNCEMRIF